MSKTKIKKEEINKILCIKPRGIGDIILSTIVLENLKSAFPNSEIHYLTEEFAKGAVENNPFIKKVLTFKRSDFILSTIRKIRKEKYDLIIDLWTNPKTAQITFLSGVKYRVGYEYRGRSYAYNIKGTSQKGSHHNAEHNLELLKALNVPIISKNIHYYLDAAENENARIFINKTFPKEKILICILPTGGWETKRCEAEKWVEICKALYEKYSCSILVISGPGDEEDANYIKNNLQDIVVHAQRDTLSSLAGLINNCNVIIANDSGPMHLSAALNKPTLGIFGPTSPFNLYPYNNKDAWVRLNDLFCIECNLLKCPYNHECMRLLDPKIIVEKVKNLLT